MDAELTIMVLCHVVMFCSLIFSLCSLLFSPQQKWIWILAAASTRPPIRWRNQKYFSYNMLCMKYSQIKFFFFREKDLSIVKFISNSRIYLNLFIYLSFLNLSLFLCLCLNFRYHYINQIENETQSKFEQLIKASKK